MPLATLLIANRGEIACRIIRTARAMGLATVAVHSDPDTHAPHVDAADVAVRLAGASAVDTYLDAERLIDAAVRSGADAIHPGYGFLAENAAFAAAVVDAGLTWVGPAAATIAAMGDKLQAKTRMAAAGVPVLRSSEISQDRDIDVDALTFPVLVKAAAGGGGKGMRIVDSPEAIGAAIAAARREAASAFGDDRVFVEPFVTTPRHVEVQILGDAHGSVVHLGERDCSIQRRYQKIIEESPSPAVDPALRVELCNAAVAAGAALDYTSAGTVEFILSDDGTFHFLEVNTRLQVEHPVTEEAWGLADGSDLDLVRLQLLIADGQPLPFRQDDVICRGHAIEARLYAEDPGNDFLPVTGRLDVWDPQPAEHEASRVRVDAGVCAGFDVSPHYDPLLAKVIAAAPTRLDAARLLAASLARSRLHGVTTNRDLLVTMLRHEAFLTGSTHTGFIDLHVPPDQRANTTPRTVHAFHAQCAALTAARRRQMAAPVLATVPPGWRNNRWDLQRATFDVAGDEPLDVGYAQQRDGSWTVDCDGVSTAVWVRAWPDERADAHLVVERDGMRHDVAVTASADGRWGVDSLLGSSTLTQRPRFAGLADAGVPGGLVAPMPGTVVTVEASEGARVDAGDLLLVLEAMKMEHRITAPHAGTISQVHVDAGDVVDADDVLVVVTESDD